MRMRRIVIRGLPSSTIFFRIISQTTRFLEKNIIEIKNLCFDFLYNLS